MLAVGRRGDGFRGQRQLHDEARADRLVFLHANGAAMVFDDAADDGQPQSGAALLGGEVRQEQFLFSSWVTPWPVSATVISTASRLATSAVEIWISRTNAILAWLRRRCPPGWPGRA